MANSWQILVLLKYLCSIIILLLFTSTSFGIEYYIDTNTGNDTNSGTIDSPWQSLNRAKRSAGTVAPGDIIFIRDGNYLISQVNFDSGDSGAIGNPITYSAYNGENVVMDFQGAVKGFFITGDNLVFDGLALKNAGEIVALLGKHITIQNCDLSNSYRFSSIQVGNNTVVAEDLNILNNKIHDGLFPGWRSHGIYVSNASDMNIIGNEIYNNDGNGIQIQPHISESQYATNILVEKNNLHDQSVASGIYVGEQASGGTVVSNIVIRNNLSWANAAGAVIQQPSIKFYNNTVFQNSAAGINIGSNAGVDIQNNIVHGNATNGSYAVADIQFTSYHIDLSLVSISNNSIGTINSSHISLGGILSQVNNDNQMAIDPVFASTVSTNPDFLKIHSTSPAIDQGADLSSAGVTDDFFGNPRSDGNHDIGAHEFGGSNIVDNPPGPPAQVQGVGVVVVN